jgi:DNA-binding MarR family transcriptional regulator
MPHTTSLPTQSRVADRDVVDLAVTLEQTLSWLRRAVRPAEWNTVALSSLDALERLGPLRLADLVAREHITQPGMTGVVARLEAAGLVARRADPTDGRATLVEITRAGRAYLRTLHRRRADVLADHVRRLAPHEQQALVDAAAALSALVDQPLLTEGS